MVSHGAGTDYDICIPAVERGTAVTEHKNGRCVYYRERNIVLCPMAGSAFSASYNERGLSVRQVRIKAARSTMKERKSIVEHPFGTIKRVINIMGVEKLLKAFT